MEEIWYRARDRERCSEDFMNFNGDLYRKSPRQKAHPKKGFFKPSIFCPHRYYFERDIEFSMGKFTSIYIIYPPLWAGSGGNVLKSPVEFSILFFIHPSTLVLGLGWKEGNL